MTADQVDRAVRALERHDDLDPVGSADDEEAAERENLGAHAVSTTRFDAEVTVPEADGETPHFTLTVRVPMLSTATRGTVGPAVEAGWFETMERRLADAPMATREAVELVAFELTEVDGTAVARYSYTPRDPARGGDVAKTFAEYAEGTYVEGVVPGYEYEDPVAELLARASSDGDAGGRGPTPL